MLVSRASTASTGRSPDVVPGHERGGFPHRWRQIPAHHLVTCSRLTSWLRNDGGAVVCSTRVIECEADTGSPLSEQLRCTSIASASRGSRGWFGCAPATPTLARRKACRAPSPYRLHPRSVGSRWRPCRGAGRPLAAAPRYCRPAVGDSARGPLDSGPSRPQHHPAEADLVPRSGT